MLLFTENDDLTLDKTFEVKDDSARSLAYLTSRSHSHLDFFLLQDSILYSGIFKVKFYLLLPGLELQALD